MFGLGLATKIYIAVEAIDMRKGFEGLHGLVRDGSGLWVCAKRLEKGRFHWPETKGARSVAMRSEELAMLLNRLDVKRTGQRNWYRKSA